MLYTHSGPFQKSRNWGAVALEIDNQIYIPLHDQNGNVVALLDKNGQLFKEYQYTAIGIAQNPPDFIP